ncbi:MAG: hypothetical protein EBT44_02810 [Actinobacteria bacterium]|uniref:Uncharacterized protein n=1 Tax=Candidatus Fonsibacter lacus TaxID=2576439 RepID=A0A965LL80_9PROT|nr:hypothetical protein [Candidatus Fonsibacter lacus]
MQECGLRSQIAELTPFYFDELGLAAGFDLVDIFFVVVAVLVLVFAACELWQRFLQHFSGIL